MTRKEKRLALNLLGLAESFDIKAIKLRYRARRMEIGKTLMGIDLGRRRQPERPNGFPW